MQQAKASESDIPPFRQKIDVNEKRKQKYADEINAGEDISGTEFQPLSGTSEENHDHALITHNSVADFQSHLNDLGVAQKIYAVKILADVDKYVAKKTLEQSDWNVALTLRTLELW